MQLLRPNASNFLLLRNGSLMRTRPPVLRAALISTKYRVEQGCELCWLSQATRLSSGTAGDSAASVTLAARSCVLHVGDWLLTPAPRLSQATSACMGKEAVGTFCLAALKIKERSHGLSTLHLRNQQPLPPWRIEQSHTMMQCSWVSSSVVLSCPLTNIFSIAGQGSVAPHRFQ